MAGQIIIVNGTSGSGKSTTCEVFVRRQSDFWLLYGIDHFLSATFPSMFGHHGPQSTEGIHAHPVDASAPHGPLRWSFGEYGKRAFMAFHEWIASASRAGCNIAVDHLLMIDPPVLPDLITRLEGLPVLLVTLKPPYDVLEQRVAERQNTKRLPTELLGDNAAEMAVERLRRLRPWFYDAVYANEVSDLVLDTSILNPEKVSEAIERRLRAGPGQAFQHLRRNWITAPSD